LISDGLDEYTSTPYRLSNATFLNGSAPANEDALLDTSSEALQPDLRRE
jgi:hypothetical protein